MTGSSRSAAPRSSASGRPFREVRRHDPADRGGQRIGVGLETGFEVGFQVLGRRSLDLPPVEREPAADRRLAEGMDDLLFRDLAFPAEIGVRDEEDLRIGRLLQHEIMGNGFWLNLFSRSGR